MPDIALDRMIELGMVVGAAKRLQRVVGAQVALGYILEGFVVEPDTCAAMRELFGALLALDEGVLASENVEGSNMVGTTDNENDPALTHGVDDSPAPMAEKYLVLSEDERHRGFVRPVRRRYIHAVELGGCGVVTRMGLAIAETYARNPAFYGATFCFSCSKHRPVGEHGEFYWLDEPGPSTGDRRDANGLPTDVTDQKVGT